MIRNFAKSITQNSRNRLHLLSSPQKGTVIGWLKYSPSDFVFTAKLPKTITHDKLIGLRDSVKTDLEGFFDVMRPLQSGGKLGCFLIQLQPKYEYNPESLKFFSIYSTQYFVT